MEEIEEVVYSLAPELGVEGHDDGVLLGGEAAVADVRAEVVEPAQPAALAAPLEPCMRRDRPATTTRRQWLSAWYYGTCTAVCSTQLAIDRGGAGSLTGFLGHGDPVAAAAVALDVAPQRLVLLRRPRALLHGRPVAARRPPHGRHTHQPGRPLGAPPPPLSIC